MLGIETSDSVTCSFFGDGTCNVGQFYESLNMAALYKLPHVFVVENNLWVLALGRGGPGGGGTGAGVGWRSGAAWAPEAAELAGDGVSWTDT